MWDFFLFEKKTLDLSKNIFIFCENYFFNFPIVVVGSHVKYCDGSRVLYFLFNYYNSFFNKFWKNIQLFLLFFSQIFFKKLKFKGKGYYIYKNKRNTIALKMGYSHLIRLYAFTVHMRFTSKTTIFMFGLNRTSLFDKSLLLRKLKPINIFTGRGIRFSRQIVYRKPGKMSSYR